MTGIWAARADRATEPETSLVDRSGSLGLYGIGFDAIAADVDLQIDRPKPLELGTDLLD